MLRHEQGGLSGNNANAVHDMRVSSRRIRAALAFLRKEIPAGRRRRASRRVRRMTRGLGELRQFDVNAALLDRIISESPEVRHAGEFARPLLAADRGRSLSRARSAVRQTDLDTLGRELKALARRLDGCDVSALSRRAGKQATRREMRLARLWGHNGIGPVVSANPGDKQRLHAIRIATKKVRYHLEIGRRLCGWPVAGAIRAAREMQDALGDLHDLEVLRHWCEARSVEAAGPMEELVSHIRLREAAAFSGVAAIREAAHAALTKPLGVS